eukprot:Sspe_Gene.106848::Locus_84924_Transcript_1_1_Confidence_1.000_Length_471::g.106848::m.106848
MFLITMGLFAKSLGITRPAVVPPVLWELFLLTRIMVEGYIRATIGVGWNIVSLVARAVHIESDYLSTWDSSVGNILWLVRHLPHAAYGFIGFYGTSWTFSLLLHSLLLSASNMTLYEEKQYLDKAAITLKVFRSVFGVWLTLYGEVVGLVCATDLYE